MRVQLLFAALMATTASAFIEVGENICVEGFVMDFFCIDRGTLLDNPSVRTLEEPNRHSVHCLVDVRSCVDSPFEVLLDPFGNQTLYSRGFRLDENAKQFLVNLARNTGHPSQGCSSCTSEQGSLGQGFRAVMDATVVDLNQNSGTPILISVNDARASHQQQNACSDIYNMTDIAVLIAEHAESGNGTLFIAEGSTGRTPLQKKHLIHGSLMLIGWGFLLPTGTLFARFFKHRPDGLWFQIHRACQVTGLCFALIGWIIALRNFSVFADKGYNNYRHGILGMVTMVLGLLQPLNAIIRPHPPEEGEEASAGRKIWEVVHKGIGYFTILLAVATIGLGTVSLPVVEDQKKFQIAYGVGVGGSLLLIALALNLDKAGSAPLEETKQVEEGADIEK